METIYNNVCDADLDIQNGLSQIVEFKDTLKQCLPSELRLTTMTIMIKLDTTIILTKFREWIETTNILMYLVKTYGGKWNLKDANGFYNCLMLFKILGKKRVAIKVFTNGNLHITGVQRVEHAYEYACIIKELIDSYLEKKVDILRYQIQLLNGCLKLTLKESHVLCLKTLYALLTDKTEHQCMFNNDHHPGIRIKIKHENAKSKSSIMIFESGSILINAFLSGQQAFIAYSFITQFIENHILEVLKPYAKMCKKKRKRDFDYQKFM